MSETVTVATPDSVALTTAAQRSLDSARAMVIDSDAMYQCAAEDLAAIKKRAKDLEEQRTGIVKPLNEAVKRINDLFRAPLDFLAQAESAIKRGMLTHQDEQEKKRRQEEARLRAEAEKKAAEERARIEAQRKADEERARLETEKLEAERQASLAKGDTVAAAKTEAKIERVAEVAEIKAASTEEQSAAVYVAPVVSSISAPTVKGVATKGTWKGEVDDKLAMVKFIAEHPQFLHLLDPAQKEINAIAKALKLNHGIAGLRVWEEKTIASRAA